MNFSKDEQGIWGLPEGEKTQYLLTDTVLGDYKIFLKNAVDVYTALNKSSNVNSDINKKKLSKYKLYRKRLNKVLSE